MKLSLSWIFDHIHGTWKNLNIKDLINKFNTITAEIEYVKYIKFDPTHFYVITLTEIKKDSITGFCEELNKKFQLPYRSDMHLNDQALIKIFDNSPSWATLIDFGSEKEGLFPAVKASKSWREALEVEDYLLYIENKSITHRADLWSHRGVAREIAAILDMQLIDEQQMLKQVPIQSYERFAPKNKENPFEIEIKTDSCKRFATIFFDTINHVQSDLQMAHRLCRINARPVNLIIDLTNYVMFDVGQPLHAFDAARIETKKISPTNAKLEQKIALLDGQTISLTDQDIIISDGKKPLALAGIMGGADSSVTNGTKSILLEAAWFEPSIIRKTAHRLNKRTEASMRFEKGIDPNLNLVGIERFLKLYTQYDPQIKVVQIVSLGAEEPSIEITVAQSFIQDKLGVSIESNLIINILTKLGFVVQQAGQNFIITVPSIRSFKDIQHAEDIVEEIGRFFGYQNIPFMLPSKKIQPTNMSWLYTQRDIKTVAATGLHAHEVYNYPMYDEEFLPVLQWQPTDAVTIKNPVSQLWKVLVTSLIPHLLKNIYQNRDVHAALRFFELNKVWNMTENNAVQERTMFSGIMYKPKGTVDFYSIKYELNQLFSAIGLPIRWVKAEYIPFAWFHPHQTAFLMYNDELIGYAGKVDQEFLSRVSTGDAFIFECDADRMMQYAGQEKRFTPLPKFPAVWQDISMLIPLTATIDNIVHSIKKIDSRIYDVQLIDMFEKKEWQDQKSITIRWFARDPQKTMDKSDVDDIHTHITIALQQSFHANIR